MENFVALLSKDCGYPQSVAFRHDRVDKHKVIPGFFHSFPQGYPHRNDNVLCIVNKILWITDRVSCIMYHVLCKHDRIEYMKDHEKGASA